MINTKLVDAKLYDLNIEKAILGCLLEDPKLLVNGKHINSEWFYDRMHRRVFDAINKLFFDKRGIDDVTVKSVVGNEFIIQEIKDGFLVQEIKDSGYLITNYNDYVEILRDKYIKRIIVVDVPKKIELLYKDDSDVPTFVDTISAKLHDISHIYINDSNLKRIGDIGIDVMRNIKDVRINGIDPFKIRTNLIDLNNLVPGFVGGDMVVIAGRPASGKTSLMMQIAKHNAENGYPVGVVSLEMKKEMLFLRQLSYESGIPIIRIMKGELTEYEWKELTAIWKRLNELPIYIDDTSKMTEIDLRIISRRMKEEHNIEALFIDYLQLLDASGRVESRQQEITKISRAILSITKDLNIPVFALSQLSREVDKREDKRPRLSDLRESGCLTGDSVIVNADTGKRYTIKEIVKNKNNILPFRVKAMNNNFKFDNYNIINAFYSGKKEVYSLVTYTGREIKASANHKFYRLDGWIRLDDLSVGDKIAIPNCYKCNIGVDPLSIDDVVLIAHLLGDGCILDNQPYHYTSGKIKNINIVNSIVKRIFNIDGRVGKYKNWYNLYFTSPYKLHTGKKHPITKWYEYLNIERNRSYNKVIPEKIFECSNYCISVFLHHLWSTDGTICVINNKTKNRKKSVAVKYSSTSKIMILQIQSLLLRFGINSNIYTSIKRANGKEYRPVYVLSISGKNNIKTFLLKIGSFSIDNIEYYINLLDEIDTNINNGGFDKSVWDLYIKPLKEKYNISWRKFCNNIGMSYCGNSLFNSGVSKNRMRNFYNAIPDDKIKDLYESEIFWDKIKSIERIGYEDVYDLTVDGVHNFVANDIVVHNSIEQDSTHVFMLYNPSYYGITEFEDGSNADGVIEILLRKFRNGATGSVKVGFLPDRMKFIDLIRDESNTQAF